MSRTVARLLAESLEAHDVDQIYCVPGESYVGLTSELLQRNSMRVVVCRHETGAGYMAVADGRLRSRAGVAMVSRGPGMANAMGPLHTAFHDATPMVVLVGQVERKDFGRLALQEQNYSRLLADITKLVIEVNEPEHASEAIARAFHVAESGTQGPVAVILPEDIFDEETDVEVDVVRFQAVDNGAADRMGHGDLRCFPAARYKAKRAVKPLKTFSDAPRGRLRSANENGRRLHRRPFHITRRLSGGKVLDQRPARTRASWLTASWCFSLRISAKLRAISSNMRWCGVVCRGPSSPTPS